MDTSSTASARCFHCGHRLPVGHAHFIEVDGQREPVCCPGCAAAATHIVAQGLGRFYQFRKSAPSDSAPVQRDWTVFDRPAAVARYTHDRVDGSREVGVQLENLHCAACVWLIENSLQRQAGFLEVCVSLAERRAQLRYDPKTVSLSSVLHALDRIGYRPRPVSYLNDSVDRGAERRLALQRLAVAGFGMMQVMSFAAALYAGAMDGIAPNLEQLLRYVSFIVATPVVLYSARPFFVAAWGNVRAGTLGMDVPVALSIGIAYVWSVWSTLRGHGAVYFDSAVMFTFLLLLGRYVQGALQYRAAIGRDSFNRLLPESVLRLTGAGTERVTPDELRAGDSIRVLAGEHIPADAKVNGGVGEVDESLLTGESVPRLCKAGDSVSAGTINVNGILELTVARVGQDSTLAAITRLVDRAQRVRPPIAELADRVAAGFVAAIVVLAVGAGLFWWQRDPSQAVSVVLAVLVATCPCALSLATPAAIAAATARLSRAGLLVARSRGLERLARVDTVMFDKTGTLTRGRPRVERCEILHPPITEAQCRSIAAALEALSTHPFARAFAEAHGNTVAGAVVNVPGRGMEGEVDGVRYRIGCREYVIEGLDDAQPAETVGEENAQSVVLLGDRKRVLAAFLLSDALRAGAAHTVRRLHSLGLTALIASGDRESVAQKYAAELQIAQVTGEMSAAAKLKRLRQLQAEGHRVLVIGDGINDAAVLAAADVSIAVGGGADLAQVNADMVLMSENLSAVPESIETARDMLKIMRQNLTWAAIYNLVAVPLAASGWLQPWMAAVGMSLSSLLVVANAVRLLPARAAMPQSVPAAHWSAAR